MAKDRGGPKRTKRERTFAELWDDPVPPEEYLDEIVTELAGLDLESDDHAIQMVGIGGLESMFFTPGCEDRLWPRIEQEARENPVFRRALAAVWAFNSSRFEDRIRLLRELGEPVGLD